MVGRHMADGFGSPRGLGDLLGSVRRWRISWMGFGYVLNALVMLIEDACTLDSQRII